MLYLNAHSVCKFFSLSLSLFINKDIIDQFKLVIV